MRSLVEIIEDFGCWLFQGYLLIAPKTRFIGESYTAMIPTKIFNAVSCIKEPWSRLFRWMKQRM